MSLPRTVAEVIDNQVTLKLESLDRDYLNVFWAGSRRNRRARLGGAGRLCNACLPTHFLPTRDSRICTSNRT